MAVEYINSINAEKIASALNHDEITMEAYVDALLKDNEVQELIQSFDITPSLLFNHFLENTYIGELKAAPMLCKVLPSEEVGKLINDTNAILSTGDYYSHFHAGLVSLYLLLKNNTGDHVNRFIEKNITQQKVRAFIESKDSKINLSASPSAWNISKLVATPPLKLAGELRTHVFGQDSAIDLILPSYLSYKAGLGDPQKPIGSFVFAGPTGVGKTELVKAFAKCTRMNFVRFDMSEYMDDNSSWTLTGSPKGYVNHEEGGLLPEAIKEKPHSVILLDEAEKAHPRIFNLLLQVLDDARFTDTKGNVVDFKNTIIFLTSNAGSQEGNMGFTLQEKTAAQSTEVLKFFRPEFRNRLDRVIDFNSLSPEVMPQIVEKALQKLQLRLIRKSLVMDVSEPAKAWLAKNGFDAHMGARPLERLIKTDIQNPLAEMILAREEVGNMETNTIAVDLNHDCLSINFKTAGVASAVKNTIAIEDHQQNNLVLSRPNMSP